MKRYAIVLISLLLVSYAYAEESHECKSLDIREFGLIEDGSISSPWSEALLIQKYGLPCMTVELGESFKKKKDGKITTGEFFEKKQFIYSGDSTNKTSVITIVDGVVVKKERVYD